MTIAEDKTVDERVNEIISLISELTREHDLDLEDRLAALEEIEDHLSDRRVWLEEQAGEDEENEG